MDSRRRQSSDLHRYEFPVAAGSDVYNTAVSSDSDEGVSIPPQVYASSISSTSSVPARRQSQISRPAENTGEITLETGFPPITDPPACLPQSYAAKLAELRSHGHSVVESGTPEEQLKWAADLARFTEHSLDVLQHPKNRQLYDDAKNIVIHLSRQDYPMAVYILGVWAEEEKMGIEGEADTASECYTAAADGGYKRAWYRIGRIAESMGNYEQAISAFSRGATANDAGCCYVC